MPPTSNFVLPASDTSYFNRVIEGASSIELLAQIALRAQSEDDLVDLKSKLVGLTNQLAVYAQMGDKNTHSKFH